MAHRLLSYSQALSCSASCSLHCPFFNRATVFRLMAHRMLTYSQALSCVASTILTYSQALSCSAFWTSPCPFYNMTTALRPPQETTARALFLPSFSTHLQRFQPSHQHRLPVPSYGLCLSNLTWWSSSQLKPRLHLACAYHALCSKLCLSNLTWWSSFQLKPRWHLACAYHALCAKHILHLSG